jgi:hypothetical protein
MGGRGEFKYDIFDTLSDLCKCTPTQHNKDKKKSLKKRCIVSTDGNVT